MYSTKKAWLNGLYLVITLIINTLGALGLINGLSQKQISDRYPTLITPSGPTFGIWSVIYALLLIAVVLMIMKKDEPYYFNAVDQITPLFRLSCFLNSSWIVAFSFVQVEVSALIILAFVITLSLLCQKLLQMRDGRHWLLPLTFGLYAGWLLIATVVNIASALVKMKWTRFGLADDVWAAAILMVAVLLVLLVLGKIRNAAFPLPVAWAYWGIYRSLVSPDGYKGEFLLLQNTALVGIAVFLGLAAVQFYKNRFSLLPDPYDRI